MFFYVNVCICYTYRNILKNVVYMLVDFEIESYKFSLCKLNKGKNIQCIILVIIIMMLIVSVSLLQFGVGFLIWIP